MVLSKMRFECYRILVVLLLLILTSSELTAQHDSLYIRKYYKNLVPRLVTNFKSQSTSFATKSDTLHSTDYFSTGGQNFVGIEVGYKWASLSYNYGFNKQNSSSNTDLRLSAAFKPLRIQMNYTALNNLNYYRVDGENQEDTVFITKQRNISLRNIGIKVDHVFNYKTFYYSPSVSQVGRQMKSRGSFIISSGVSFQDFDLHGLSDSAGLKFLERYRADYFKTLRADVGIGYAYNWVITKNMIFSISEIPNIGFQQISTSQNKESVNRRSTASFSNYVRAGLTYIRNRFFIGGYVYNSVTASRLTTYSYNNVYTSLQLHIGLILDDPKTYWMKK